ncbi:hypothetical protein DFH07DRAFT_814464 [Mycena maculata]|uniref:Transmembrane protein n=1 Tax=Mycena maculata TaxID=230809 RepID=A0AAD7NH03_9AGAR|nr:hypothetical protein DFH07DRAFT_814464 [Mycena maculata]
MYSTASSSTAAPESRPQAGPLPRKRGEIGFSEETLKETEEGRSESPAAPLPERHPEDRGATTDAAPSSEEGAAAPAAAPVSASASVTSLSTTSTNSLSKRKRIIGFLKPKNIPSYGGLRLTTLLAFAFQVLAVAGTITGWVFAITRVSASQSSSSSSDSSSQNDGSDQSLGNASTAIFIHVVFGVATLVQLLFIERRVFRLRAERYSYLHPGEILPSARRRAMGDPSMGFSPWNRPPLPTYAAALAQSGVGTGDVEDHLIAAPPPPAYGNTRGSTFLLSGFLRDSLRAQRPVSAQMQASQNNLQPAMTEQNGRPLSYVTVDEDWEEVQNAERARRLEETLTRLERPTSRT